MERRQQTNCVQRSHKQLKILKEVGLRMVEGNWACLNQERVKYKVIPTAKGCRKGGGEDSGIQNPANKVRDGWVGWLGKGQPWLLGKEEDLIFTNNKTDGSVKNGTIEIKDLGERGQ